MRCVIVGVPPPVVYWIKDGINVTNSSDGQRQVFLNGTLNIKSLAIEDSGQYSCIGFNDKGSVKSSKVFLRVACKYIIIECGWQNVVVLHRSHPRRWLDVKG